MPNTIPTPDPVLEIPSEGTWIPSGEEGEEQPIGFKVLLIGSPGAGKTHSLTTLLTHTPLEVFALFTEPSKHVVLKNTSKEDLRRFHHHTIGSAAQPFSTMKANAKDVNTMTQKMLANKPRKNQKDYDQFVQVYEVLSNFADQHGKVYGAADSWDVDKILWIDSLSGLNEMAMNLNAGGKSMKSVADWGIAINTLQELINKITTDCRCHVVLTSHIAKERDELTGGYVQTVSTLGKALAPNVPRYFDDAILARFDGSEYTWSVGETDAIVKGRFLKQGTKGLDPDFGLIYKEWKDTYNL